MTSMTRTPNCPWWVLGMLYTSLVGIVAGVWIGDNVGPGIGAWVMLGSALMGLLSAELAIYYANEWRGK